MTASSTPARLRPTTLSDLEALPQCGPTCPVPRPFAEQEWAVETQAQLGWCGVRLRQADRTTGYALVNVADSPVRRSSVDPEVSAAAVTALWVARDCRGQGMGRQLVQGLAAAATRSGLQVLLAVGSRGPGSCAAPPVGWWQRQGFRVATDHPIHPVLRLDLDRTVRWAWWSEWWDRVRHSIGGWEAPPHPTSRSGA